jgi:dihydropyrimidinase
LHLLYEGVTKGKISMNRFVEITSTAPAKIFGMYGKKGTLAIGADADVVVWDPNKPKKLGLETLHMRIDYSPFEGHVVPGSPSQVFSRGDLIVENDQWVGKQKQGRGQFVRRGTFGL